MPVLHYARTYFWFLDLETAAVLRRIRSYQETVGAVVEEDADDNDDNETPTISW